MLQILFIALLAQKQVLASLSVSGGFIYFVKIMQLEHKFRPATCTIMIRFS